MHYRWRLEADGIASVQPSRAISHRCHGSSVRLKRTEGVADLGEGCANLVRKNCAVFAAGRETREPGERAESCGRVGAPWVHAWIKGEGEKVRVMTPARDFTLHRIRFPGDGQSRMRSAGWSLGLGGMGFHDGKV